MKVRSALALLLATCTLAGLGAPACKSDEGVAATPPDAGVVIVEEDAAEAGPPDSIVRCAATPLVDKDEEIKIVTINLRHDVDEWERRFPLIADEIVRLAPDVVGLQEIRVSIGQAQKLKELIAERAGLPYVLYEQRKTGLVGQINGEGVGIFSRFPIEQSGFTDLGTGGRVMTHAVVRTPAGGQLTIFNTHLHNEGGDDIRLPQAQIATRAIRGAEGCGLTVLTGDMNANDQSATVKHLVNDGLVDSYRAVHQDAGAQPGNTSPIVLKDGAFDQKPKNRIDYIFIRPVDRFAGRVEALTSEVTFMNHDAKGFYPSDHLGVVTTVRMKF